MTGESELLSGKVVIVTGGGGGIGAGIARLAGRHGAKVVVNDLGGGGNGEGADDAPARRVVAEIIAAGGEAIANFADVSNWESAQTIIQDAITAFGRIDGVVNNAGVLRDSIFHKQEERDWDIVVGVNLKGCFNVARAAAPYFKAQNSGAFVHMTSASGLVGNMGQANYSAAKLGVVGLSKSIALDMERFHVRSNCIAPFAYTRLIGTIPEGGDQAKRLDMVRQMAPEKVAPLVIALISDAAADVTAQIFGVRKNEIFLFSQPRPIRSVHRAGGWQPETCISTALPALRPSFYGLDRSPTVFTWDPI